jgi:toxin FitB
MSRYLLDTNVVSIAANPARNRDIATWLAEQTSETMALSIIVDIELRNGIALKRDPVEAMALARWHRTMVLGGSFGPILPADFEVISLWYDILKRAQAARVPRPAPDTLIAATAIVHRRIVVTRNFRDFRYTGAEVLDPATGEKALMELP